METGGEIRDGKWLYPVPVVRAIVENEDGHFLLLRRRNTRYGEGEWCLPGGKIDYLSTPEESVVREVEEESGLRFADFRFLFYRNNPPLWEGAMQCLNLYFAGKGQGTIRLNPESSAYQWVRPEEWGNYPIAFGGDEAVETWLRH